MFVCTYIHTYWFNFPADWNASALVVSVISHDLYSLKIMPIDMMNETIIHSHANFKTRFYC